MKCPHLTGKKVKICGESSVLYVPSIFELEEYCQTARAFRCPFLHKGVEGAPSELQQGADTRRQREGWIEPKDRHPAEFVEQSGCR